MSHRVRAAPSAGTGSSNPIEEEVAAKDQCLVRGQDRLMPVANVTRIMKKVLPPHAKISGDAKETILECVSEYISFITSEANARCQHEGHKTVTAVDVIWAVSKLGFDDYVEPLILYLHRYMELEGERAIRADPKSRQPGDDQYGPPMGNMIISTSSSSDTIPGSLYNYSHEQYDEGMV